MKVFQYLILWHPNSEEKKDGKKSLIIKDFCTLLAQDEKQANLIAARAIPEEYIGVLEQVEIAIRPF